MLLGATAVARAFGTSTATLAGECWTDALLTKLSLIAARVITFHARGSLCDTGYRGDREGQRCTGQCESKRIHDSLLAGSDCSDSGRGWRPPAKSTSQVGNTSPDTNQASKSGMQGWPRRSGLTLRQAIYTTANAESRMKIDRERAGQQSPALGSEIVQRTQNQAIQMHCAGFSEPLLMPR